MKIKTSKKQSWKTILALTITGAVFGVVSAYGGAQPVPVENPSFELNSGGNPAGDSGFLFGEPFGWERYFSLGDETVFTFGETQADDYSDGSLLVDEDSTVYSESAPNGNRVLILFTGDGWDDAINDDLLNVETGVIDEAELDDAGGIVEYGVEQTLGDVLQGSALYMVSVYVGNIGTGPNLGFGGFPGYRIQLLADGQIIGEDFNQVTIGEREFAQSTFTVSIPPKHSSIGDTLSIRLINMNDPGLLQPVPSGDYREVNFDDVRIDFVPGYYIPDQVSAIDPTIQWLNSSSPKKSSQIERFFSITGKGKKRLLLAGRGASLHSQMKNLIQDPILTVLDGRGNVVAKSDDWAKENDASEISKVLGADKAHSRDAGVVVELPAGDYSIVVKSKGEQSGYGSSEIYDLDPESKTLLKLPDAAEKDLRKAWK